MATDDGEARGEGCGTAGHVRGSGCKVHLPTSDAYTEDRLTSHVPGAPPLSPSLSQPGQTFNELNQRGDGELVLLSMAQNLICY